MNSRIDYYKASKEAVAAMLGMEKAVAAFGLEQTLLELVKLCASQINGCDGGGCTDTSGARYTGGVGNTVLDQNGRNCTRSATTVQCF